MKLPNIRACRLTQPAKGGTFRWATLAKKLAIDAMRTIMKKRFKRTMVLSGFCEVARSP
jgi:hypothetical protein